MVILIVEKNSLKIFLDESGTPGDVNKNIPFIFGGFYTFKNEKEINSDWEIFLSNNQIPYNKKSTYFPKTIWLPFAEFLLNGYYPIITYSYFSEEDKDLIKQKCEEYNEIKHFRADDTPDTINSPDLIWNLFSAISINNAILLYIYRYRKPITQISIQIDRFHTKDELKNFTEYAVKNFISPERIKKDITDSNKTNSLQTVAYINLLTKCLLFKDSIQFCWNIKKVKEFPGAVCSLYRRNFENINEANEATNILKSKSIFIDATEFFRNRLKTLNWYAFLKSQSK